MGYILSAVAAGGSSPDWPLLCSGGRRRRRKWFFGRSVTGALQLHSLSILAAKGLFQSCRRQMLIFLLLTEAR